jgi:hypothetical protein
MEKIQSQHKFCAEPDSVESKLQEEKNWYRGTRLEVIMFFIMVSSLIHYANIIGGGKGVLCMLVAIALLFWFVSIIQERIAMYKAEQKHRADSLIQQMTAFICASALKRVDEKDLKRIFRASTCITGNEKNDLSVDDFSLIKRTWHFWEDKSGFECQADTVCINCGFTRREHSQDGNCPKP